MNNEPYILAIDLGTTLCKLLVVDSSLQVVHKLAVEYGVDNPLPAWSEQNPLTWWEVARTALQKVCSEVDPARIQAIGLSGQMHGLVALDKDSNPLRPAILWNDQRSAPQCAEIYNKVGGVEGLLAETNNPMLPGYTGGKLLWVRENEPQIYEKIRHFCLPKDYLRYRLVGEIATDVSDASGTGLYDVRQRRWADGLLEKLQLPQDWFPKAMPSGEYAGEISAIAARETFLKAGTPVIAGGGDAVMQMVGSGGINSEVVLLVIGTGGNVSVSLLQPIANPGARLQVFCHVLPQQWVGMGVTLSAGSSLKWFRDRLGSLETGLAKDLNRSAYELLGEEALQSPAGARSLIFLPYLQGERAPHADPWARGAFIGLSSVHTKQDMIRAVMEGVSFSLRDVLDLILKAGITPERVNVSGGGSSSPVWRQILADVFNRPVTSLDFSEDAGAVGAAIVAGVRAGIWETAEKASELIQRKTVDQPIPGQAARYSEQFAIYKDLYPALKPSFDRLAKL